MEHTKWRIGLEYAAIFIHKPMFASHWRLERIVNILIGPYLGIGAQLNIMRVDFSDQESLGNFIRLSELRLPMKPQVYQLQNYIYFLYIFQIKPFCKGNLML